MGNNNSQVAHGSISDDHSHMYWSGMLCLELILYGR